MEKYLSGVGECFIVVSYGDLNLIKTSLEFVICKHIKITIDNNVSGLNLIHWNWGHYFNSFKEATEYLFKEVD